MSNKEMIIDLINGIPDSTLSPIVEILQYINSLANGNIKEIEPDEWDLQMISEAKKENDGDTISFEELLEMDGLSYDDL